MRDLALMSLSRLPASAIGVADGRPVAGHADLQLVHQVEQQPLVEGQRALGERLVPEDHEADPVALPLDDEVLHDLLDRRQPVHGVAVDLEVHRAHRAGGVEAEHDVDAGGLGLPRDVVELRPRGRQHQQREAEGAQDQRDPAPDPAAAAGHPDQRRRSRGGRGSAACATARRPPSRQRRRAARAAPGGRSGTSSACPLRRAARGRLSGGGAVARTYASAACSSSSLRAAVGAASANLTRSACRSRTSSWRSCSSWTYRAISSTVYSAAGKPRMASR